MFQKALLATPVLIWATCGLVVGYVMRGAAVELGEGGLSSAGVGLAYDGTAVRPLAKPLYACSMLCLPPQPNGGPCAACGMDMVVVGLDEPATDAGGNRTLTLSPRAQRLASISVAPVERKLVSAKIRMVGQVDYDEYNRSRNRPYRAAQSGRNPGKAVARLGVTLEAYEPDLAWIRLGQTVALEADPCPGEIFDGKIVFIDSKLDNFTRTVEVRVRVPNLDSRLKLLTLVRATISANLDARGQVINPQLGGKWLCPMHADVAKNESGKCELCGMDLRAAETLGYHAGDATRLIPPLVIPASAPLITGKRAVVYVAVPGSPGTFEGRTIVLGPRAGDHYVVLKGLVDGESVVVNGNFKIDGALQILARESMMSSDAMTGEENDSRWTDDAPTLAVPDGFRLEIDTVLRAYFAAHAALSHDDFGKANEASGTLWSTASAVRTILLDDQVGRTWQSERTVLLKRLGRFARAPDLERARTEFEPVSNSIIGIAAKYGASGRLPIYRFHCPMAFDNRGADWLQKSEKVENPYFGSAMLRCGKLVETISPRHLETPHEASDRR